MDNDRRVSYDLNALYSPEHCWHVHEQTQEYMAHTDASKEIERLMSAFSLTFHIIPARKDDLLLGHTFAWCESHQDLQVSHTLALFGLYKHAHAALRSALDLGLLQVYWSMKNDGNRALQDWLRSRDSTPFTSRVWKDISQHPNFVALQNSLLKEHSFDLEGNYQRARLVSDYVHTRGGKFANAVPFPGTSVRIPGQRFSAKDFETWRNAHTHIIRFLAILYLVRYPIGAVRYNWYRKFGNDIPFFGGIPESWASILEELVTSEVFHAISHLAERDPDVLEIMSWIKSLPDRGAESG